jgi:hypothetical protein
MRSVHIHVLIMVAVLAIATQGKLLHSQTQDQQYASILNITQRAL